MHLMHSVRRVGQGSVDGLYAYVGIGQGRARRQEDIGAGQGSETGGHRGRVRVLLGGSIWSRVCTGYRAVGTRVRVLLGGSIWSRVCTEQRGGYSGITCLGAVVVSHLCLCMRGSGR